MPLLTRTNSLWRNPWIISLKQNLRYCSKGLLELWLNATIYSDMALPDPKFPLQISRWEIEICTTIWPSFKRWYFKYVILSSKTLSTNLKAKPTFSRSENIPNNEAIFLDFHGINGSTTASGFSYSHTHRIHGTDGVFTWNGCLVGGFNPFEKY